MHAFKPFPKYKHQRKEVQFEKHKSQESHTKKTKTYTFLSTHEALGNFLGADIEKQAEGDRHIKIYPQNVGFNGSAKADGRLKISQARDEAAARSFGRRPDCHVEKAIEQVGANPQL